MTEGLDLNRETEVLTFKRVRSWFKGWSVLWDSETKTFGVLKDNNCFYIHTYTYYYIVFDHHGNRARNTSSQAINQGFKQTTALVKWLQTNKIDSHKSRDSYIGDTGTQNT